MNTGSNKIGLWMLRLGLAATYLYSSYGLFFDPISWVGYLPAWFTALLEIVGIAPIAYLKFQAVIELLIVASLLTGRWMWVAALASAAEIAGILAFYGVDGVSFRDMAILGAALSLFFFTRPHNVDH